MPNEKTLNVHASKLTHPIPILHPVPINLSNGLSPDEAAIIAVITNPTLRVIRDERALARAQLINAGILPNPRLSASLEIPTGGATEQTLNAYGFQLDWGIINALLTRTVRINAAEAHQNSIDLAVAWEEWQVAEAARLHWMRTFWLKKKVKLLKNLLHTSQKNLRVIEKAWKLGIRTTPNLSAAKTFYQKTLIILNQEEENYQQERLTLEQTIGFPLLQLTPLQDLSIPQKWFETNRDNLLKNLEKRRLDLIALKFGYESQEEAVRAAILSQFPKIGIGMIHARDTGDIITTGPALTLELPIFNWNQGKIAIERASRKKLFDEYIARLYSARANIISLSKKIDAVKSRTHKIDQIINTQQALLTIYRKALKTGNAEILSYYQKKITLMHMKLELLEQWQNLTDLRIALEAASGFYVPLTFNPYLKNKLRNESKK